MPEQTDHLGMTKNSGHSFETGRDSKERAFYQTYAWRRFRKRMMVKARAIDEHRIHDLYKEIETATFNSYIAWIEGSNPLCVDCLEAGHIRAGTVADHIHRIRAGGGRFDPENIQWLCSHHHNVKSGKEGSE